jgi:hypothetical protein
MSRISSVFVPLILAGFLVSPTVSPALQVSSDQMSNPPTREWLESVLAEGAGFTWREVENAAAQSAVTASRRNRTDAMEGWLLVARWARLLDSDQRDVTGRWIEAINSAKLGHRNMRTEYSPPDEPLSAILAEDFVAMLVANAEFSSAFFYLLTPYDYLPAVLSILERLHRNDPKLFARYEQLALAIALVYDMPPPPDWPHGQVPAELLSRQLRDPLAVFKYWIETDQSGVTLFDLDRLGASELKFVIDTAAPWPELNWVQERVEFDFDSLPRAYDAIAYRQDRIEVGAYVWPGVAYTLPTILAQGGICIDQAYFASHVGKARGVPTLLFRGVGLDGRHAWFGYLDAQQTWQFDVGRYAEQQLVAGIAFDPQTWGNVNDHELAFLAERFHRLPQFRQSRAWLYLAQEQLRIGDTDAALAAAAKATGFEPRNVSAWDVRVIAERAAEVPLVQRESTLRAAARALQRYPDLYARFMREAILTLRERGQISAAEHQERLLARRFAEDRSDIAILQAAEMLNRTMAEDDPGTQLRVFESALRQFGVGAGMGAFDRLVRPFFEHAMSEGRKDDAATILQLTLRMIPIQADTQFASEMALLAKRL